MPGGLIGARQEASVGTLLGEISVAETVVFSVGEKAGTVVAEIVVVVC